MTPVAPVVFGLVGVAAFLHATWNALLKSSADPLLVAARALGASTVLGTPVAVVVWLIAGRPGLPLYDFALAALSALLELAYFIFLSRAYLRGDLSAVYPIARGTAPLLTVLIGTLVLGERLAGWELAGVVCLLVGIWATSRPVAAGSALLPALATGVMIALYSAVDRVGVRLGPPLLYGWVLWIFASLLLFGWVSTRRPQARAAASDWLGAIAVGIPMTAAYLMVLVAFSLAPLAVVSPLRESAIVLVTGWGIWRLRERRGAWLRVGGAGAIVLGIALIALR